MARQVRIEYPGAFCHAFSRGNQKQPIFLADDDRYFFLECLREVHEKFGAIVHAFCLMPNHFHLILETPLGKLSKTMHFIITRYTVHFNNKHERHGHLFQGRFRAVLIEAATYAQELSRYIHLNPVRTGIADRPERYAWSSYGYYRGTAISGRWLDTAVVLRSFGERSDAARKAYTEFVTEGIGAELPASIKGSVRKGILRSEEFIARIAEKHLGDDPGTPDREKPRLRRLRARPDLPRILSISKRALGPSNRWVVPIAVLVSHDLTASKLAEIGEFFSLSISGVSSACARARAAAASNVALASALREIKQEVAEAAARGGQTYFLRKMRKK